MKSPVLCAKHFHQFHHIYSSRWIKHLISIGNIEKGLLFNWDLPGILRREKGLCLWLHSEYLHHFVQEDQIQATTFLLETIGGQGVLGTTSVWPYISSRSFNQITKHSGIRLRVFISHRSATSSKSGNSLDPSRLLERIRSIGRMKNMSRQDLM